MENIPITDPYSAAIYGNMDPINIPQSCDRINIPAPWIRHGLWKIDGHFPH